MEPLCKALYIIIGPGVYTMQYYIKHNNGYAIRIISYMC